MNLPSSHAINNIKMAQDSYQRRSTPEQETWYVSRQDGVYYIHDQETIVHDASKYPQFQNATGTHDSESSVSLNFGQHKTQGTCPQPNIKRHACGNGLPAWQRFLRHSGMPWPLRNICGNPDLPHHARFHRRPTRAAQTPTSSFGNFTPTVAICVAGVQSTFFMRHPVVHTERGRAGMPTHTPQRTSQ